MPARLEPPRDEQLSEAVITRRRLLFSLGAVMLAGPQAALAQQQSKVARVGFLYFGSRQAAQDTGRYDAFVQGMRELGYVEGRNLIIEARYGDGKNERPQVLAAELVRLKVDVIVATGTPVYRALQHATSTIPVVLTVTSDPVGDGFAASMARPGRNMTGLAFSAADLGPKLLELLKTVVPHMSLSPCSCSRKTLPIHRNSNAPCPLRRRSGSRWCLPRQARCGISSPSSR